MKIKGKILNTWGIMYALVTFAVAIVVLPFMGIMAGFADIFGNKKQRKVNDYCLDKSYFRML